MKKYEIFDHTADIGIYAYGESLAGMFENAASGMFSIIADISNVAFKTSLTIKISGFDKEDLFVRWLSELLYLFDFKHILFGKFQVEILNERLLNAVIYGEPLDLSRHEARMEIKAVTYHGLELIHGEDGVWRSKVLFDI